MNDGNSAAGFATTHWSIVLSAGAVESPQARSALESLCRSYWYPLYAFIRRRGYPQEDARDLVQSFFAHILGSDFLARARRDKGRFRSYLLGALNYFLADERNRDQCQKRGGGQDVVPWMQSMPRNVIASKQSTRWMPPSSSCAGGR